MIYKATKEDAFIIAAMAIKMWQSHATEELTAEFKELLAKCEEWAREKGCTEFASDCELTNDESLAFHLKMGFIEANRIICFTKQI